MTAIRDILAASRAFSCVECGKCSASCAMAAMYAHITLRCSPRALVQQALRLGRAEEADDLWRCLQCGNCSAACPEGVDPALLIRLLREEAAEAGNGQRRVCASCGRELLAQPAADWLRGTLSGSKREGGQQEEPGTRRHDELLALCGLCRGEAYALNNSRG